MRYEKLKMLMVFLLNECDSNDSHKLPAFNIDMSIVN